MLFAAQSGRWGSGCCDGGIRVIDSGRRDEWEEPSLEADACLSVKYAEWTEIDIQDYDP